MFTETESKKLFYESFGTLHKGQKIYISVYKYLNSESNCYVPGYCLLSLSCNDLFFFLSLCIIAR